MSEEQPASDIGSASAKETSRSRESFIRRASGLIGMMNDGCGMINESRQAFDSSFRIHHLSYSGLAAAAAAGREPTPSRSLCSHEAQSMFEKNASMYLGRSAGL